MIKKIPVERLQPGMYVADLGSERLSKEVAHDHGYVVSLGHAEVIRQLQARGIAAVFIDTDKGLDAMEAEPEPAPAPEPEPVSAAAKDAPLADEAVRATHIHNQALHIMKGVLADVKMGRAINLHAVKHAADDIVASIFRNHNALSCLGMIRLKDNYLMEHSVNLAVLIGIWGRFMEMEYDYIREMAVGALLHDVGKILVPDSILHKPGRLDDDELVVMKTHPYHSHQILAALPEISPVAVEMAEQHHEKVDGSGYPSGLVKEQLSLHGRMLAIVDVYDAITADRCYHDRITPHEALRRMLQWVDSHFDSELLAQFIKAIGVYPIGSVVCLDSGKMGVVIENHQGNLLKPTVRVFYHYLRKTYLPVEDIELAKKNAADHIVKIEDPRHFHVDASQFLQL